MMLDLPNEIIDHIIDNISWSSDISSLARTCSDINQLIKYKKDNLQKKFKNFPTVDFPKCLCLKVRGLRRCKTFTHSEGSWKKTFSQTTNQHCEKPPCYGLAL